MAQIDEPPYVPPHASARRCRRRRRRLALGIAIRHAALAILVLLVVWLYIQKVLEGHLGDAESGQGQRALEHGAADGVTDPRALDVSAVAEADDEVYLDVDVQLEARLRDSFEEDLEYDSHPAVVGQEGDQLLRHRRWEAQAERAEYREGLQEHQHVEDQRQEREPDQADRPDPQGEDAPVGVAACDVAEHTLPERDSNVCAPSEAGTCMGL